MMNVGSVASIPLVPFCDDRWVRRRFAKPFDPRKKPQLSNEESDKITIQNNVRCKLIAIGVELFAQ
jgi:hypothetical protein